MNAEQREFLEKNRLCIVGAMRRDGPPQLSPVYYVLDGDDLLISTTLTRAKTKALQRDPRVSVCALGEQYPFPYLTIYGVGRIEPDGAVEVMMRVGAKMTGNPVPDSMRPAIEQRAKDEQRVVLRVIPESCYPDAIRRG